MNEDKKTESSLQPVADPLFEVVKNLFLSDNSPTPDSGGIPTYSSTKEIFELFYKFYPSDGYGLADVANWLHAKGFNFVKTGSNYEWELYTV